MWIGLQIIDSQVMVSKVSRAGQEQGLEARTGVKTVLNETEESRASSLCRIEEIRDC